MTNNTPQIDINAPVEPRFYTKTLAALQMIENGIPPADALKVTNNARSIHPETVKKVKEKYARWSLTRPKIVKLANNQITRILTAAPREVKQQIVNKAGEVVDYIEQIAPTDTNILTAVGMVYDRIDPIKHEDTHNVNVDMLSMVLLAVKQPEGKVEENEPEAIEVPVDKQEST